MININTDERRIEQEAFFKLSYGLFVLTGATVAPCASVAPCAPVAPCATVAPSATAATDTTDSAGIKMNGCIINTAQQLTDNPKRVTIAVNAANYTRELILSTNQFNISVLTQSAPFEYFKHFGFQSGRAVDKFSNFSEYKIASNGIPYITAHTNAYFSAKVIASYDFGSHTLFVADVTEAVQLSNEPSATYDYYFKHIKPSAKAARNELKATNSQSVGNLPIRKWQCTICGYVHEGTELPSDFICPVCNHGAQYFVECLISCGQLNKLR